MLNAFLAWIGIKQKLDSKNHTPPHVSEGDIWWCAIGQNVGIEINGKSKDFTRPIIILKKFGRLGFLGIPSTTRQRIGTWYVSFTYKGLNGTAVLSQARVISYKRLHSKLGSLNNADFKKIKEAYVRLFY